MKRFLPYILIGLVVLIVFVAFPLYQRVFSPAVSIEGDEPYFLLIPNGADYIYVAETLKRDKIITNPQGFQWVARRMNYPRSIRPGRYKIEDGMSNRELIQLLRSGQQTAVRFTFVKFRRPEDFALHAAQYFEFGKTELMAVLNNREFLKKEFNLTPETVFTIIIPNTYEIWWNTPPEEFIKRMYKEYRAFWGRNGRREARQRMRLTRQEVMTLASIVEEETIRNDERPKVAGVYLNRIRKSMPLQADPTVKFAVGNFELRRILNEHLEIDSPYNTYKYPGIPPGPICTPSITSIDAVLANERHKYYYFCAKTDGSGYHHFSKTLMEHNMYANQYHQMLNQKGIR
ncbi:MAG: endolytic transglycosylase MltG [Bacteroidota bacterium]